VGWLWAGLGPAAAGPPTSGSTQPTTDIPWQTVPAYISAMCPGNDNQVDWTAAATPQGERMTSSLSRPKKPAVVPQTKRSVMDTLLGESKLSAHDAGGSDPYNATGRQFRR
jgi:hypothetical protein